MNPRRALLLGVATLALGAAAGECPAPAPGGEDWPGQKAWLALERAGYRLGAVEVVVGDIYESDAAWYARGANFLHLDTRERVVRQHLVLAEGEPVVARKVYESLRELRALGIFREARFEPLSCAEGAVAARVSVADAWTLILSLKANSVGGQTSTGIKLEDRNFLGSGKEVYVERTDDATRSTVSYAYEDPALLGSDWRAFAVHSDQSDGTSDQLAVRLPFLTLDQPWGFEFVVADVEEEVAFHQSGAEAWRIPTASMTRSATAWRLLAKDDDSGWRIGLGLRAESRDYGALLAVDPTLRPAPTPVPWSAQGVTLAISRFHDHWASFRNITLFDRVEDFNLGLDATLRLGLAPEAVGANGAESTRHDLAARWATRAGPDGLLALDLDAGVRDDDGDWNDGLVSTRLSWYDRSTPGHTRLARLGLEWRHEPDPEHEISLGGIGGLLGYPAHWQVGDRAWLLHLEDRAFTDRVLFQTFKVGYSVVLEAGAARRVGTREWSDTLANIGAGFRLGNLRGAYGQVLYFTVFVPLVREPGVDPVQIVVGDVISF